MDSVAFGMFVASLLVGGQLLLALHVARDTDRRTAENSERNSNA